MSRSIRLIACAVVFVVGTTDVRAQSEAIIRGQLVADADGSVLSQGAITLTSMSTGTSTKTSLDTTGHFTFPSVGAGDYVITGVADGFSDREVRLTLAPREVRTVTVRLAVLGVTATVNVTGELAPLPRTHSPSSTSLPADRILSL
jgi:hypothetical protein